MTCKWYPVYPMKHYTDAGVLDPKWVKAYCKDDREKCIRYALEERAKLTPIGCSLTAVSMRAFVGHDSPKAIDRTIKQTNENLLKSNKLIRKVRQVVLAITSHLD